MVLIGLVIAAALAVFIIKFGSGISTQIEERLKPKETLEREQKERESAQADAEAREKKGAIGNSLDFIFGEGFFDESRGRDPASIQKQQEEAIARADAELEFQAQQAGFKNRDEAALETDSGAIVIGSSKNTIDFGLITGAARTTVTTQEKKRLAGGKGGRRFG